MKTLDIVNGETTVVANDLFVKEVGGKVRVLYSRNDLVNTTPSFPCLKFAIEISKKDSKEGYKPWAWLGIESSWRTYNMSKDKKWIGSITAGKQTVPGHTEFAASMEKLRITEHWEQNDYLTDLLSPTTDPLQTLWHASEKMIVRYTEDLSEDAEFPNRTMIRAIAEKLDVLEKIGIVARYGMEGRHNNIRRE